MKKIMCFVLLCLVFGLFGSVKTFAGQYDVLPNGKNYLSLSNIRVLDIPMNYARTIDPIRVKSNTTYTLVFDYYYLGQLTQDLSGVWVEIEENEGEFCHDGIIIDDRVNERAYFEFTTYFEMIQILIMPNGHENAYNIMLYEGSYADFDGFLPYIHPSEVMSYQGLIPMDYDVPLTMNQITSYITARNSLGHAIAYDVISDSYSTSQKLPGDYQMVFQVTNNMITKNYLLDIRVFDLTSPVIHLPQAIEVPLAEKIDVNQIKTMLEITDNVDTIQTSSLSILSDTYTPATTVGTYHVLFEASDTSGNKSTLEVAVTLIDSKGPVISGPQLIYLYTSDAPLTNEQILAKFSAVDDVDGTVGVSITYNLYNQVLIPGVYQLTLTSSDSSSNITNRNINIHIVDNKGPVFETNDKIIEKSVADTMTDAEIITWFKGQLELSGVQASNVSILFNEYSSNERLSGSYYVYFTYDTDGIEQTSRVRIDVIEEENDISYWMYILICAGLLLIGLSVTYYVKKKRL